MTRFHRSCRVDGVRDLPSLLAALVKGTANGAFGRRGGFMLFKRAVCCLLLQQMQTCALKRDACCCKIT
uniref:Uncharacterized protein n=1 Tax=Arundo donax TaxID=35708 RepID=A0A0A8XMY3_ARUDO